MKQLINYAFIDSQNLNLAIQDQGWKLDYKRFRIYLKEKYSVKNAYLFLGYVSGFTDLYTSLQSYGYIVVFKPTLQEKTGKIKGNCDAELVLHAMIEFENYEKAVIVTGDGDFYCLVDYFKKQNKLLKLLIPNSKKYSSLLKPFGSGHIDFMNTLRNKLEYKKNERQLHKD